MIALTVAPAASICGTVSPSVRATAAIAFIGCTAIGIENVRPVMMLNNPAKNRAAAKFSPFCAAMPTNSGRKVPKSPREPAISWRLSRA